MTRTRFQRAAVVSVALLALIYLGVKALDLSNGQDLRLVWIAGQVWLAGGDPYGPAFEAAYVPVFGPPIPSHFWVYPPYWLPLSAALAGLPFGGAVALWNGLSLALVWGAAVALAYSHAGAPGTARDDGFRPLPVGLRIGLYGAVASLAKATVWTLSIGQTSLLVHAGVALLVLAAARRSTPALLAGVILVALKPQVGIIVVVPFLVHRWAWRPLLAAGAVLVLAALPLVLREGPGPLVRGYLDVLFAYNSAEAIANLPQHLVGAAKLLSLAGITEMSSKWVILVSVVLVLAVAGLVRDLTVVLAVAIVASLLFAGLHVYDLTYALCLVPVLLAAPRPVMAAGLVALVALWRTTELSRLMPVGALDSHIFPGSLHATVAILLLCGVAAEMVWRAWSAQGAARPAPRTAGRSVVRRAGAGQ